MSELSFDDATHTYRLDGVVIPSVTQVLEATGVSDYSSLPAATREAALARGSAVHILTELADQDDLLEDSVDPALAGYLAAWRKFRADEGFEPDLIETLVCNQSWRYGGRLDRTGKAKRTEVLLDIKTGTAAAWVKMQLAAYAACIDNPRSYQRWCVELHADGTYQLFRFKASDFQEAYNDFVYLLTALNVRRKYEGSL